MDDLKLGKLPDRTPVKLTITVSPDLHRALQTYAELYRETYGEAEPISELIPYMLESFLAGDRTYVKVLKSRSAEALPDRVTKTTRRSRHLAEPQSSSDA